MQLDIVMRVTINTADNSSLASVTSFLNSLPAGSVSTTSAPSGPGIYTGQQAAAAGAHPGIHPEAAAAIARNEAALAQEEMTNTARPGTAAALLNDTSQPGQGTDYSKGRSATATATLSGGTKGKTGDLVQVPSGETGTIIETYRGVVIVSFETGQVEEYKAADCVYTQAPPQEDEKAPPAGQQANYNNYIPPGGQQPYGPGHPQYEATLTVHPDAAASMRGKANVLVEQGICQPEDIMAKLRSLGAEKFDNLLLQHAPEMSAFLEAKTILAQQAGQPPAGAAY